MKVFNNNKTLATFLCITLLLSFGQPMSAAEEINLTTEEGHEIGIGTPQFKSDSEKNNSKFANDKSESKENESDKIINNQKTKENNKVNLSVTFTSSDGNSTLELPFEFKNGEYLKLYETPNFMNQESTDEKENTNVVGTIFNKNGNSIGIFTAELVGNQEKENLIANINGNNLELHINTNNNYESNVIQITAETTYYSTYFNSFEWINRGGDYPISLSLNHTDYFYEESDAYEMAARGEDAWDKVVAVHSGNSNWENESGLEDQFICHVHYAGNKNPWNIEPSRPDYTFLGTVAAACNPGSGIWD